MGFEIKPPDYPALPAVEGTRINSGKKTSFAKPDEFPTITNNNYREAMATTPGILVSEEPSSPIVNFGYRGLDSQRSDDDANSEGRRFDQERAIRVFPRRIMLRSSMRLSGSKSSAPVQPCSTVRNRAGRLISSRRCREMMRNFISTPRTRLAPMSSIRISPKSTGRSDQFGYYVYYDHRQREGFRENSDYHLNNGSAKLVYDVSSDSRFILTIDAYNEDHGEPGGLTAIPAPGAALYQVDRNVTTRFFDRFRLQRYYGVLEYQKIFSEHTELDIKAFGGYLSRYSHRQRGGGFGVAPDPNPEPGSAASTDDIQDRQDYTEGVDARLRHDYPLGNDFSTITGGVYFYHASAGSQ